jgi:uncharacterized SAM-binding protein YcdF (DUF218 family)
VLRACKVLLYAAGVAAIAGVLLCFTSLPWEIYHWLGQPSTNLPGAPDYVVVLGGGGIPSESGLMRCFYGAAAAAEFPEAPVIVALPEKPGETNTSLERMCREMQMRGVAESRLMVEDSGRNTREQALNIRDMLGGRFEERSLLIISSPEHLRRSVMTFRKAGFEDVGARAAWNRALQEDLNLEDVDLGGNIAAPDVGGSMFLRYIFWDRMVYLHRSSRELIAIAYYWLKGWV